MRAAILGGVAKSRASLTNTTSSLENNNSPDANHNLNHSTTTAIANVTPTRPRRPSRPPSRPPLQSRDSNVMMRVPNNNNKAPLSAKSGNPKMPSYEKQNPSRPLMPVLSAVAKTSNRAPLTPRVAGTAPPTVSTPLARRGPRSENDATLSGSREDLSTPVSTFLNNNITPRSGSRKSRVDSANTTPNGTPAPPSPETFRIAQDAPVYGPGLGISGMDKDLPKRPTVSFSPAVSDIGYSKSQAKNPTADSKFFFASEAKSAPPPKQLLQSKTSTFFYANGDAIPQPPQSSSGSVVGSVVGEERTQPKFFHANGTPDLSASPSAHFPPPKPSSVVSSTSRMASPRLATASPGALSPPQRPTSPSKLNQQASIASLRNTPSLPSPVLPRPQAVGRGQSANSIVAARRASIEIAQRAVSHGRSLSAGSNHDIKAPPARNISSGSSTELQAPPSPLNLVTTSLPASTPEELTEDEAAKDGVKTGLSMDQLNELAANARRERKVLDLEITNSSLAAINRTLEREMRKQTAELRRYRRLSRSGRLSIATSASMRSSTSNLSIIDDVVEGSTLSDMSEEEEEEEEEDSFSDSEGFSDEASLSPGAMAESDLRHRQRDEKRLQLDLSKHQQLLIDSQKMNQSLKRCQALTEELINEGKKALEYHVRVSDVELGGRVLPPDEVEDVDEGEEADNEGMSNIGAMILREARKAAASGNASAAMVWRSAGRDDRDSGVELDGSGAGSQQFENGLEP